jgi:F-box-like
VIVDCALFFFYITALADLRGVEKYMAPSAVPLDACLRVEEDNKYYRVKRIKLSSSIGEDSGDAPVAIPSHPLGIKPSGNAYTASRDIKFACGLFRKLPDELLNHFLEKLDALDLVRLGGTCKALYAFTSAEELWKNLFIGYVGNFLFKCLPPNMKAEVIRALFQLATNNLDVNFIFFYLLAFVSVFVPYLKFTVSLIHHTRYIYTYICLVSVTVLDFDFSIHV